MKIVFQKDVINEAVGPLMSGVSTKMTLASTTGILIEASLPGTCVLTTFDLEKGVRLRIEADVIEPGSAIVNATRFSQIVRVMEGGDITMTVDDRMGVSIVSGRAAHTMTALRASDFPEIPTIALTGGVMATGVRANGAEMPRKTLRTLMSKCMYAMGVNDQRPVLNGLYFSLESGKMTVVSCDSFKMATSATNPDTCRIAAPEGAEPTKDCKFILPNKAVSELYKLLSDKDEEATVSFFLTRRAIVFIMGDITFFCKLIEGEYIDYNRIILRNHRIFVRVDREALITSLEHAALITEERVAGSVRSHVRLEVEGGMLKISATSGTGSAYDELPVNHEGNDLIIAFNNRYLIDSLRACDADTVRISLSSPLTSINIEPEDCEEEGRDLFMLLPVRMKD